MSGLMAMSLNLLVGLTGLVSFGHAAYFATGAYAFGQVTMMLWMNIWNASVMKEK
jgi:ABC-type branched-subunit amino acid transport system permease subunit